MGTWPPVIDISHDMQVIHCKPLNQLTQGNDELLRLSDSDNRAHDRVIVRSLIHDIRLLRNQLFDDIGKILRQGFPHLGAGVFAGCPLADLNQTVQGNLVPVLHVVLFPLNPVHLLLGIINKSSKSLLGLATHSIPEDIIDFTAHCSRTILEHMGKCLIFPVDIRKEMLGSFRKVQNRL